MVRELFSSLGMSDESRFVNLEEDEVEDAEQNADLAANGNDDWLAGPSTPAPSDHMEDGYCSGVSEASYKMGCQRTNDL